MVLGSIFVLKILEKKWWVLSKEEERRRGSGLQRNGHGSGEREPKRVGRRWVKG